jgi:hypothetical protein
MAKRDAELLEVVLAKVHEGREVDVMALEDLPILRETQ